MGFQYRKNFRSLSAGLALLIAGACSQVSDGFREQARISDPAIVESSGVAVSRQFEGVLWTHNDDGPPTLFALESGGKTIRTYELPVRNNDWEDICLDVPGNLYLLDNTSRDDDRHIALVHVLREPNPFIEGEVSEVKTLAVGFEEPGYDTEALFVWQGTLFLVTKPWDGTQPRVFSVESSVSGSGAKLVGELPLAVMITGGDISPDGTRIALSSYRALLIFEGRGSPEDLLATEPIVCPLNAGQVEGISWEGKDLILTNEQGLIYRVLESEWRNSEAPFQKFSTARIPDYSPGSLEVELPGEWARGAWLERPGEVSSKMGRVAWSPEGLHVAIKMPDQLRLSELSKAEREDLDDWFQLGRVYLLINPKGDRRLAFGSNDRCIVVGTDSEGAVSCEVRTLLPATVIQNSESAPGWINLEAREQWILVTLNRDGPGLQGLEAGRKMGFNVVVVGEEGKIISWMPLTLDFSWDAPSFWGLVELVD